MQKNINNQSMLKVGTILRGTYRIDSYLSSGGFGNTYVATNTEFDERVAIKEFFMKGVTQRDDNQTTVSISNTENTNSFLEQKEKFKKEARRLRRLQNEYIISVHDLFEENGTAYYVMDYVEGENLSERLKRTGRPMTEEEVGKILPQILNALQSVHDAGIWHLDLKPANIMIDKDNNVKLIDFGASKQLNAQKGGATTSTAISYTNGYAPREQMEQNFDKFGPWTDFYALGATLYHVLTMNRPPLPSDIDDEGENAFHFSPIVGEKTKNLITSLMNPNRNKIPTSVEEVQNSTFYMKDETNNANDENTKYINNDKLIQENGDLEKKQIENTEDTILENKEHVKNSVILHVNNDNYPNHSSNNYYSKNDYIKDNEKTEKVKGGKKHDFVFLISFLSIILLVSGLIVYSSGITNRDIYHEVPFEENTSEHNSSYKSIEYYISDLQALIEGDNTSALCATLNTVLDKAREIAVHVDVETAKYFLEKVKELVVKNAEKIKSHISNDEITYLIDAIANLDVDETISQLVDSRLQDQSIQ